MNKEALTSLREERQKVKKPGSVVSKSVANPPANGIAR
jgi:hypothetical protein